MDFKMIHMNINVMDLKKSIAFYQTALKMEVDRSMDGGSFTLTSLENKNSNFELELTYLHEHADYPYDLGENETHLCFEVDDFDQAYQHQQEMG